jgi:hypothetical protein
MPIRVYFTDITFATGTHHPDGSTRYGGNGPGEAVQLDPDVVPAGTVRVTYRGGRDLSEQTATFTGIVHCPPAPNPTLQRVTPQPPSAPSHSNSTPVANSVPVANATPAQRSTSDAPPAPIGPAAATSTQPASVQPASAQPAARLTDSAPRSADAPSRQLPETGDADWLFAAGLAALAAGVALRLRAWLRPDVR